MSMRSGRRARRAPADTPVGGAGGGAVARSGAGGARRAITTSNSPQAASGSSSHSHGAPGIPATRTTTGGETLPARPGASLSNRAMISTSPSRSRVSSRKKRPSSSVSEVARCVSAGEVSVFVLETYKVFPVLGMESSKEDVYECRDRVRCCPAGERNV